MTVAPEILNMFGWRNDCPNIADRSSATSLRIASAIFDQLGVTRRNNAPGQTLGSKFEKAVKQIISRRLPELESTRDWRVGSRSITEFAQYAHLDQIRRIAEEDAEGTLQATLGTDYLIRPDVTVGIVRRERHHLHAAVSCKWTIRSDRVQNIRHEGVVLTRHRRGRQPHIVAVTAEPLPSRLAAIARGTGELDCVYHVTLPELRATCPAGRESDILEELEVQERLRPFGVLPEVIAYY